MNITRMVGVVLVLCACSGSGESGRVPLYGGGCDQDADCELGAVCRTASGAPGLCTTECSTRTDCDGWAECLPEGLCIERCLDDAGCDEGTVCLFSCLDERGGDDPVACLHGWESMGVGRCYPPPPQ